MSIEENLKESIKKHLPEMAAKEMSEFIKASEADKKELQRLQKELNDAKDSLFTTIARNNELAAQNTKLKEEAVTVETQKNFNESWKQSLIKQQLELDRTILEIKLEAANSRNGDILELTRTVFRNPVVKETVHRVDPVTRHRLSTKYNSQTGNFEEYSVAETLDEERIETTKKEIE